MLTEDEIGEYQRIHRQICGADISRQAAQEQATKLIVMLEKILK